MHSQQGPRRVIHPKETLTRVSVTSSDSLDLHHARVTHALRLASSGICGGGRTRSGTACPLFNLSHKTLVVGDVPPGFLPVRYHLRVHTEQNALEEMSGACGDFAVRASPKQGRVFANHLKHPTQPIASIQPITSDRGRVLRDLTGSIKDPPLYPLPQRSCPHLQQRLNLEF